MLCNNGYMGMVRQWQELIHGGRYSHSYNARPTSWRLRAPSAGARRAWTIRELDAALAECLAHDGPYFLDVAVAAQENCPMMPRRPPAHDAGRRRLVPGRDELRRRREKR